MTRRATVLLRAFLTIALIGCVLTARVQAHAQDVPNDANTPEAKAAAPDAPALASPDPVPPKPDERPIAAVKSYCETVEGAAAAYALPQEFFVRLIWQESNFDPKSVSRAGAQGIAQFMPGTARWRGLADPFEPVQALYESARWLSELRVQFGNLGLAAAAYNAGPRRVENWLAGRGHLPGETRAYVRIITGKRADDWVGATEAKAEPPARIACQELAMRLRHDREKPADPQQQAAWGPWGLQLLGNWSQNKAFDEYRRLQKRFPAVLAGREPMILKRRLGAASATWYLLRVAESSRERANALCARLSSAGGNCLVAKN
jgi:hypothetical protein